MRDEKENFISKAALIAVVIMASSNILSRSLGFLRIKAVAHVGGASMAVDAYVFAFILPDMINHFLAGSALSITFIPIFQKLSASKKNPAAEWKFFSNLLTSGTIIFSFAIIFSILFTDKLLFFAGNNIKNPEAFALTVRLTRIILPAQLFFFWGALLNGVQYAHKKFLLPAFTPIVYNLGIILGGLILYPRIGIEGFSWGVLLGAFFGNVVVQIPGAYKVGMRFKPLLNVHDKNLMHYAFKTVPFIVGLGLTFSNELFTKLFGSHVSNGSGAIATLDYAYKIMFMLVGLFGQSVAAGMYPFLSQLAVEKRFAELNKTLTALLTKIATILIPISMLLWVVSDSVIEIMLRGGKLSATDAAQTANYFRCYLIGAFFCAMVLVVNRAFFALEKTYTAMIITSVSVLLAMPIFFILTKINGAQGVAWAISISSVIMACLLYGYWSWMQKNTYWRKFLLRCATISLISCIGMLPALWLRDISLLAQVTAHMHYILAGCIKTGVPLISGSLIILILYHLTGIFKLSKIQLIERLIKG